MSIFRSTSVLEKLITLHLCVASQQANMCNKSSKRVSYMKRQKSIDFIKIICVFVHNTFDDTRMKRLLSNVDFGFSYDTTLLGNSAKTVNFDAM